MSSGPSVFIPIVPRGRAWDATLGAVAGEIVEVLSVSDTADDVRHDGLVKSRVDELRRHDQLALAKDFDRVAAPLRSRGGALYRAGCTAVGAVQKLGLRRPVLACYQRLRPAAWISRQRLLAVNAKGPDEGRSAELALALALLLGASGARLGTAVIATGALERDISSNARSSGLRPHDVEVLPVGELRAKLRLILDAAKMGVFEQHERRRHRVRFFTPCTLDLDGHRIRVEELPEAQALRDAGIDVTPVRWLSEAAATLRVGRTRILPADALCIGLLGACLLAVAVGSAWNGWQRQAIPMRFVAGGATTVPAMPFRVCPAVAAPDRIQPLEAQVLVPTIPAGGIIGWQAQIGQADGLDGAVSDVFGFAGYHVVHALVSRRSMPVLALPTHGVGGSGLRIPPGGVYSWQWLLNSTPEDNTLVILAKRGSPFDLDRLRADLHGRFVSAPSADGEIDVDLVGAVNYLRQQAPGALVFGFRSVDADPDCNRGVDSVD